MGCIVLYLLNRRKRLREGANAVNEIFDAPYHALASEAEDRSFGERNGSRSDFKRKHTSDSLYDHAEEEGQVMPFTQDTPTVEGSGNETTGKTND